MKLYYNEQKIYHAVPDAQSFWFAHTTKIPLTEFEIDEVNPTNKVVCQDLLHFGNQNRLDVDGNAKYYITNNELHSVDNWEEHIREEQI